MKTFQKWTVEIILIAAAAAGAVALVWPYFFMPEDGEAEYMTRRGAQVIKLAVESYMSEHNGVAPDPAEVLGGDAEDILLKEKHLLEYPPNAYRENGSPMKKTPFEAPAPGDFAYYRNPEKKYLFRIVAFGRSGPVFEYESREI